MLEKGAFAGLARGETDLVILEWLVHSQPAYGAELECRVTTLTRSPGFIFIFDSLHQIASHSLEDPNFNFPSFLSSFLKVDPKFPKRQLSVLAVYHTDIPLQESRDSCAPSPLTQLKYLATSVINLHSVAHLLAQKRARDRSLAGPVFGLDEEADGVIVGLNPVTKTLKPGERGIVIELEHRRKSGRGVIEWFFLPSERPKSISLKDNFGEHVILLGDHPLFQVVTESEPGTDEGLSKLTFDLSLTDRQRLEREGVVLPYYDAQKSEGGGEGGRIIYEMGAEDDFDDEEDED